MFEDIYENEELRNYYVCSLDMRKDNRVTCVNSQFIIYDVSTQRYLNYFNKFFTCLNSCHSIVPFVRS